MEEAGGILGRWEGDSVNEPEDDSWNKGPGRRKSGKAQEGEA